MPHAEIKYSADLDLPLADLFQEIERTINAHDPSAGACKGRAFPARDFHHSHILVELSLLSKPNRGAAFTAALMDELERRIKALVPVPCAFSMALNYSGPTYVTNMHDP